MIIIPQILLFNKIIFAHTKYVLLSKLFQTLFVLSCIIISTYLVLLKFDILTKFSNVTEFKNFISNLGFWGVFIYILIQILQVVFLPIPASIICIVGSLIFGPILGGMYCCIGVVIGSLISYGIGKLYGYKLVSWIIGIDNTDKYSQILRKRGGSFLAIAFLMPMFPDDILCFIAGITQMPTKTFTLITLITRPIGVICMAIFGSGYIIPFSGWGVYVWLAILLLAIVFMLIIYKWQDKFQDIILNKVFFRNNAKINHRKS